MGRFSRINSISFLVAKLNLGTITMNKNLSSALVCSTLTALLGIDLALPTLAETPSLNDGIICVAGKAGKKGGYYFYTSTIDDSSISQKQPVSVTLLQRQVTVSETDLLVIDKTKKTVTLTDIEGESVSNPEAQIVDTATTTLTSNNTFTGKTKKGSPISFTISENYSKIKLTFAGKNYSGSCH